MLFILSHPRVLIVPSAKIVFGGLADKYVPYMVYFRSDGFGNFSTIGKQSHINIINMVKQSLQSKQIGIVNPLITVYIFFAKYFPQSKQLLI